MEEPHRILILEDVPSDARLMEHELRKAGVAFVSRQVETREAFLRELREFAPDLILSDYVLPQFDGMTALTLAQELAPGVPFLIVTGTLSEETAVECMKSGAADYVIKEHLVRLGPAVKGALQKKQAEEELHRAQDLFRRIVETSGEGIWIIDHNDRTIFVNRRMTDLLGATAEQMTARPVLDFVYKEDHEILQVRVARGRQGIAEARDLRFRRADGSELWTIAAVTPFFQPAGVYAGFLAMITDITERKRFERELAERAEQLARSNAELERFTYVAAHDLKEPLRTVASFVQLLAARYQGKLGADADRYISFAVEGAHRMNDLIQGLLAYSRVASSHRSQQVASEEAFRAALTNLQAAIAESGAVVEHDALPEVVADPIQLSQVFQNLVGNAIKFHGPEPPRVQVSATGQEREWVFSVRDNGIGIEPQHCDRIFTIFQRLHGRTEYPGTGLGLAISKKIVECHGGRIWVDSEPGQGSAFYFTIPKEAPARTT